LENLASAIAAIATTIAAIMTAANLGARFTGWGFVVFSVGSVAWTTNAALSGQTNLLWQNVLLTVINLIGIWRWLGREARYERGAEAATEKSAVARKPSLFPTGRLQGGAVVDPEGNTVGHAVDAMAERADGRISYLVIREGGAGGIAERLHALPWADVTATDDGFVTRLHAQEVAAMAEIAPEDWPAHPARA
jgi:hypothetical protein